MDSNASTGTILLGLGNRNQSPDRIQEWRSNVLYWDKLPGINNSPELYGGKQLYPR